MTPEIASALEYLAHVLAGPVVAPYPAIDPESWADMRCRVYAVSPKHCRCPWCLWERRYRPVVEHWRRSDEMRPRLLHALPYGSLAAALEAYARQVEGIGCRSHTGSLADRQAHIAMLGTHVQVTHRYDRDPREVRDTDASLDVHRALVRAYAEDAARRGLTTAACVRILVSCATEARATPSRWAQTLGVSTATVEGVVRSGKRGATVDLAARGVIPEPRAQSMLRATYRRREELT